MTQLIRTLTLLLVLVFTCLGQMNKPDPRWQTVGAGPLANRPATCSMNKSVYICNGAGCGTNGTYHYCTAANTWTASGSSVGARVDKASWWVCVGVPCVAGANLTAKYISAQAQTLNECEIVAGTSPTGASLIVDILNAGVSVFGGGTKLVLAAGASTSAPTTTTTFANPLWAKDALITISITQIGSTIAGQDVSVMCQTRY